MDQKITNYINSYSDWRGDALKELRTLISSNEELSEDFKWGVPVWSNNGLICAISGFKEHVKINFFQGAHFANQSIFNSGLDSKDHRSINFGPNDTIKPQLINELILEAIRYNGSK